MSKTVSLPYELVCYTGIVDANYEAMPKLYAAAEDDEVALFAIAARRMAIACGMLRGEPDMRRIDSVFMAIPNFQTQSVIPCALFVRKDSGESFAVTTIHCLDGFEKAYIAKDTEEYNLGGFGFFNKYEISEIEK